MKQILVAVDFSKSSLKAVESAIIISNKTGAKVTLVWVEKQDSSDTEYSKISIEDREDAKNRLNEIVESYKNTIKKSLLSIKLRKGKIYQEIVAQSKLSNADLIILGSQGTSGFEDIMVGSNTFRIVSHSKCPALIMPSGYSSKVGFDNIVIPLDSTSDTCRKVQFTIEFAKHFDSTIHILGLNNTSLKSLQRRIEMHVNDAKKIIEENGLKYFVEFITTDNITKTILNYSDSVQAGLISIMTEQSVASGNFHLGPNAQQIVNQSALPVLSIQY